MQHGCVMIRARTRSPTLLFRLNLVAYDRLETHTLSDTHSQRSGTMGSDKDSSIGGVSGLSATGSQHSSQEQLSSHNLQHRDGLSSQQRAQQDWQWQQQQQWQLQQQCVCYWTLNEYTSMPLQFSSILCDSYTRPYLALSRPVTCGRFERPYVVLSHPTMLSA